MRFSDILRNLRGIFERKRKNPIQLERDSNLESNLKFLKVDTKSTPIQISEDTVNIQGSLTVNGVTTSLITALNDATENELVTIGATTTELDAETNLTWNGFTLTATSANVLSDNLVLKFDGSNDVSVAVLANGSTSIITTGTLPNLTLTAGTGGDVNINAGDNITIDATDVIEFDSDGRYIMKADGTEFSAANSAYAGMILGYTCIGANVADDSYTLTTSFVAIFDSGTTAISVTFKTPPSEYVEIEAELYFSAGSGASDLELTLSDNAIYGGNSLTNPLQFEKSVREPARGHSGTVTQKWFLQANNLAAIGSSNTIYIAAKCDSTSGTPIIRWGGDASGEYTNLVMKATALPATIVEGS